jgi:ribonuclease VapC
MVIDSSALLAILLDEPGRRRFVEAIEADPMRIVSAATVVECSMVLEARHGPDAVRDLDLLLARAEISVAPVDVGQASEARHAFRKFGRGRHRANLNFGDCFAYALSRSLGEPLLFEGSDFALTDVTPALPATAP